MSKNRVLVLALIAAVMLPGCLFSIRGFSFSALRVKLGGKVIARLTLAPTAATDGDERGRVFILVYIPVDPDGPDLKVVRPTQFDIHGNFGGPRKLVEDPLLEEQIFAHGGQCDSYLGDFAEDDGSNWVALTTETPVRTQDELLKTAETRIGIKAPQNAARGARRLHFYAGAWTDNDEIEGPSPEDDIGCMTSVETILVVGNGKVEL